AELLVEEERERRPENDLDGDSGERQDEGVLDRAPELVARDELAVVPEADPSPRVGLRVVVLEGADEADDERIDRERDEIQHRRAEQQQDLAAPLRWRGA